MADDDAEDYAHVLLTAQETLVTRINRIVSAADFVWIHILAQNPNGIAIVSTMLLGREDLNPQWEGIIEKAFYGKTIKKEKPKNDKELEKEKDAVDHRHVPNEEVDVEDKKKVLYQIEDQD